MAEVITKEMLNHRYTALLGIVNHTAQTHKTVHQTIGAHLREISGGKHANLAIYHMAASVTAEEKFAQYSHIASALGVKKSADGKTTLGTPDWSKLKGSLGQGAKAAEPEVQPQRADPVAATVAEPTADLAHSLEVAARDTNPAGVVVPNPKRSAPVVMTGAGEDDTAVLAALRKLLTVNVQAPEAKTIPLDDGQIRLIANEEIAKMDFEAIVKKLNTNGAFPADRVAKMIEDAMANQVRRVVLVTPSGETKPITGLVHKQFDIILKMTSSRTASGHPVPLWLDGPPGGGKSHLMEQVAEALGLEAHILAIGPTDTKSAIVGSVATGTFREGIAYQPYKNGGVLGIDEIAAGDPGVLVSTNSLVANQSYRFPNGELVKKHKDFHVIAADNTRGHGNVKGMVRNRLDAATLDRFAFIKVAYDENLEATLCGNSPWAAYVKKVRDYIAGNSAESVYITPRASINGAALLAGGCEVNEVVEAVLFRFCSPDLKNTIITNVGTYQQ